jgi:hypothetical protein
MVRITARYQLECTRSDILPSDYNFVLQDGHCVAVGPEPISAGVCEGSRTTFLGSSGYRKIPGDTCTKGLQKDKKVEKDCSKGMWRFHLHQVISLVKCVFEAEPHEGQVIHQIVREVHRSKYLGLVITNFVAKLRCANCSTRLF